MTTDLTWRLFTIYEVQYYRNTRAPASNLGGFHVTIGDAENDRMEYTCAILSGTLMAAPHVTAAFALLKSHFPQRSQRQIRLALAETASNPDGGCNDEYGYGIVQVKDAYDWLDGKGSCEDWVPEDVSAGGCQTRAFTMTDSTPADDATQAPTVAPATEAPMTSPPTVSPTKPPTPEPTLQSRTSPPTAVKPPTPAPSLNNNSTTTGPM